MLWTPPLCLRAYQDDLVTGGEGVQSPALDRSGPPPMACQVDLVTGRGRSIVQLWTPLPPPQVCKVDLVSGGGGSESRSGSLGLHLRPTRSTWCPEGGVQSPALDPPPAASGHAMSTYGVSR